MGSEEFSIPSLVSADSAMWDRVRESYPALAELSDTELGDALKSYIETPPTLSEVLLKTPVGPVLLINLILAATGFSYCDLPFTPSDSAACLELAARAAAQ